MSTPSPVTGYVLAGGSSRRFGRDKALLPWQLPGGSTLLEHMTRTLAMVCDPVITVGRGELPDEVPGLGPIGGIATALHSSRTENNIIVAVDLPLLTSDFLKYFKERCRLTKRLVTACNIESAFPLCLGIRARFISVVEDYLAAGRRNLHGLVEAGDAEIITASDLENVGFKATIFANINTKADYEAVVESLNHDNP